MAAVAASAAASAASAANEDMKKLQTYMPQLEKHPVVKSENLQAFLPKAHAGEVNEGHGFLMSYFLPPLFNLFMSMSSASDGEQAQREFAPILQSLRTMNQEVDTRKEGENKWVNGEIDKDLNQQMVKHGKRVARPA